ncbi:putative membrane protein [Fusarium oxysporum f. sp. albedinis]|nr:putative membrane protein [Fusarium oxysporum f. sp. albedinis]
MDYRTFDSVVRGEISWSVTQTTSALSILFILRNSATKMSPARKKRADSGSAGSTPPRVDPAESGLLPPEHWSQLPEEENTAEDGDSAVLDNASSTASLTSSILQYRTINGRAYQSERGNPEYWGPIDDTGQEAMDIK